MTKKITLSIISLLLFTCLAFSQKDRKVVVLDLTIRNQEVNQSRILSAMRMCDVAGIAYDTTSSLEKAFEYPIILFATKVKGSTFDSEETMRIKEYTANGGVLIISNLREKDLYEVAGISESTTVNTMYRLSWNLNSHPELFHLLDDPLEQTISLGRESSGSTFNARHYTLSTGMTLATYENDSIAAAVNEFGSGRCYTFGPDFRDLIYRNMIDFDIGAHRSYSNGFEPTSDVICFWLRNIVKKHIPNTAYKHTVPYNAKSVIMITHDIDSRTAMDTMQLFSDYESFFEIPGHYNVTTRYFRDELMSDFYIGTATQVESLIADGHTIASHSVGHFPDFAKEEVFPYGHLGSNDTSYRPSNNGEKTAGGTVIEEVEVSKTLLEKDHDVNIVSFRAGHLAFPDSLGMALEETGYLYNSTHSANNILTSFPFYIPKVQSFNTVLSEVLEIPLTISDVFHSDPIKAHNYPEKVNTWLSATQKYHDNNSPIVLLIHPNRQYKLQAQVDYFNSLPEGCEPYSFEEYGKFWKERHELKFHSRKQGDTLMVQMENEYWTEKQSFILDNSGLNDVRFINVDGEEIHFESEPFSDGQAIYFIERMESTSAVNTTEQIFKVYPNPSLDMITVEADANYDRIFIVDIFGQRKYTHSVNADKTILRRSELSLPSGIYFLVLKAKDGHLETKKVVWE